MNKLISYFILSLCILFLLTPGYLYAEKNISFHTIKDNCSTCSPTDYIEGKKVFNNYKFHWLSENFQIEKTPKLIFKKEHIANIIIEKYSQPSVHLVTVQLNNEASNNLKNFTASNKGSKIAFIVGENVLTVLGIHFVLEHEFSFYLRNMSAEEILTNFEKVSSKVKVEK